MIFLAASVFAFLTALLFVTIVLYVQKRRSTDIFHRMRRHNVAETRLQVKGAETVTQTLYHVIQQISKPFLIAKSLFTSLDLKLRQAGIPLAGIEIIVATIIGSGLIALLIYMLTLDKTFSIGAACLVPIIPIILISYLIRKRRTAFTEQLGDCLVTIANALRAGYSFQQAVEVIAKEMEPPISQEFSRMSTDIRMGITLDTALEQMNARVNSKDFELVTAAVLIQREVGGNLAQILDTISDTINDRIRMKREINALTAQGRLSAIVLVILPIAVAGFMYVFNRSQMIILIEEPIGQMAVAISLVMDVIGFWVIRKIVDIEV